jgi:CDP-diacylglycerol--glycerol-3-phosphate 3-phosphatidyltransferase
MFPFEGAWARYVALGIFALASFTDFLDGYIARKKNLVTNFGKFMDPLADKLLVCSALICLLSLGDINVYVVLIIIFRDFIISGFRLIAAEKGVVIAANWWGKIKTVMQMVMVMSLILSLPFMFYINIGLQVIVVFLTVYSLCDYVIRNRAVLKD